MKELLQQASSALGVHDAETLERLAADLSRCTATCGLQDISEPLEVLRRQVKAARSHIQLQRRLMVPSEAQVRPWAR